MTPADATMQAGRFEFIRTEQVGAVACILLNRPQARNALNASIRAELRASFSEAEANPSVRAVLVAGEGESFCAGADIKELEARTALGSSWAADRLDTVVESMSKPVVGALQGYTLGGGLELALSFAVRIGADNLKAGFPEIKLGVFPALGGTQRLPRLVGEGRAIELMLTGRIVDANEALRLGLVTEVVPAANLRQYALDFARRLAAGPPVATRVIIEAARRASDLGRSEGLDYERRLFGIVCATSDKQEGVRAWLEKRPPKFTGN
jgi:enoyl-CoA hydratase